MAAIILDPPTTYCSEKLRLLFWEASGLLDPNFIRESAGIVVATQREALKTLKVASRVEAIEALELELKEWQLMKPDAEKPSS